MPQPQSISQHHLLGYEELRDIYPVVSLQSRKESVRMLERILTETDASVKAVNLQYREYRTRYRSICPRLITQKPVPRYEPVRIEEIRYRSGETQTGNGIPDMYS